MSVVAPFRLHFRANLSGEKISTGVERKEIRLGPKPKYNLYLFCCAKSKAHSTCVEPRRNPVPVNLHYLIQSLCCNVSRGDACCLTSNILYLICPHLPKCVCMLILSSATCWGPFEQLQSWWRRDDFALLNQTLIAWFYLSA